MNKPAAFLGTYVDLKFLSGLKVARVTLEIPIERSQEFIGMFGTPNKADPAWCALARIDVAALNAPTVPEKAVEPAKAEKAETKRSSRAYLMLRDVAFRDWLASKYLRAWRDENAKQPDVPAEYIADAVLKSALAIESKSKLDTDPEAAARFDALRTDFELRDLVR